MKMRLFGILTVAGGLALSVRAVPGTNANDTFKNDKEKVSYSIGVNIGTAMKNQQFDVDGDEGRPWRTRSEADPPAGHGKHSRVSERFDGKANGGAEETG